MNTNPFELINERLISIEKSLLDLKQQPKDVALAEQLLTVKETAKFLNLTSATIYSKCSRGELPFMKRSKRVYFSRTELLDYLKEGLNSFFKIVNPKETTTCGCGVSIGFA